MEQFNIQLRTSGAYIGANDMMGVIAIIVKYCLPDKLVINLTRAETPNYKKITDTS